MVVKSIDKVLTIATWPMGGYGCFRTSEKTSTASLRFPESGSVLCQAQGEARTVRTSLAGPSRSQYGATRNRNLCIGYIYETCIVLASSFTYILSFLRST